MAARFKVSVEGGRATQRYEILMRSHDATQVHAAEQALKNYRDQGLADFPYNKRLTVTVEESDDA